MEDVVERAVELIERVGLAYLFGGGAATDLPNLHTELTGRVSIGDWDDETGEVWLLRGRLPELSVAWYGEWLRHRGTFVASRLLPAALRWTGTPGDEQGGVDRARAISTEAASLFEALLVEGPLSSVEMRRATDLTGAERTPTFSRALRALRRGMLITTFGVGHRRLRVGLGDLRADGEGVHRTTARGRGSGAHRAHSRLPGGVTRSNAGLGDPAVRERPPLIPDRRQSRSEPLTPPGRGRGGARPSGRPPRRGGGTRAWRPPSRATGCRPGG